MGKARPRTAAFRTLLSLTQRLALRALVLPILMSVLILPISQALAWTITADFESGTLGQMAQGPTGFSVGGGMTQTTFDNTRPNTGTKSAKAFINAGNEGWGEWGGLFVNGASPYFHSPVGQGGELWFRMYVWFPSDWNWQTGTYIKIMRVLISPGSAKISLLANRFGGIVGNSEVVNQNYGSSVSYSLGTWQFIEMYIKLHATPGQGIFRAWKNGVLVFENTTHPTLPSSSHSATDLYVFSQWNDGSPVNQSCWIDDIKATTFQPANRDAQGHYMIGAIGGEGQAPTAPGSLRVAP